MSFKIGSLFDGSGGFPLAGFLCGGEPTWASEVEPYPIAVTKSRFPHMKHLGSVTDVKGNEVEPVDVITFGSPCQDLSVAGKRAGLKHEDNGDDETTRSGLFMEAVRIIKEMREATNGKYPRFAVWENVPGAFSSNKGEDFRIVLEELIKISEPNAVMPGVPKKGWAYADSFCGNEWSLAYRVFDAQYWGVPQRRRRIYLVLDLGGQCAREVLFEREGLRGYFAKSRTQRETVTGDAKNGIGTADCERKPVAYSFDSLSSNSMKSANPHSGCRQVDVAKCLDTTDPNPSKNQGGIAVLEPVPYLLKIRSGCEGGGKGALIQTDMSATLATNNDQYLFQPVAYSFEPGILRREGGHYYESVAGTLRANAGDNQLAVAAGFCTEHSAKSRSIGYEEEKSPTLRAGVVPAVVYDARGNGDGEICPTITGGHESSISDYTSVVLEPARVFKADDGRTGDVVPTLVGDHNNRVTDHTALIVECCIDGDKIGKAERAGGSGLGIRPGDKMYTLTAKDRHAVAYLASGKESVGTLMANAGTKLWLGNQEAFSGDYHIIEEHDRVYRQGGFAEYIEGEAGTNRASGGDLGGGSENLVVSPQYIVRRLTPTECARLQGFLDCWGHPDYKDDFTDEEYKFWLNVRNTHAAINEKQVKDYTKAQMLTWYNKLHTDSSEYKLWGNGIALPNALYVMEGISEVLK